MELKSSSSLLLVVVLLAAACASASAAEAGVCGLPLVQQTSTLADGPGGQEEGSHSDQPAQGEQGPSAAATQLATAAGTAAEQLEQQIQSLEPKLSALVSQLQVSRQLADTYEQQLLLMEEQYVRLGGRPLGAFAQACKAWFACLHKQACGMYQTADCSKQAEQHARPGHSAADACAHVLCVY